MKRILVLLLVLAPAANACGDTHVDISKKASPDGTCEIDIKAGSLKVIGWNKNEIHIEGSMTDNVKELRFDVKGDKAVIEAVMPSWRLKRAHVDLTVHVPMNTELDIETVSAGVEVEGVSGDEIDVQTVSGSIEIAECPGDIEAECVSGGIKIADAAGDIEVQTISGSIHVAGKPESVNAESVSGNIAIDGARESVDVEAVSASIRITGDGLEECSVETVSGSIQYHGSLDADGDMEIDTLSGSVTINFTEPVEGDFELSSFSGSINTNYSGSVTHVTKSPGSGSSLRFKHGNGDAKVDIQTFSGSITITMD